MKVFGTPKLQDLWSAHADVRRDAQAWLAEVKNAEWRTPHDVRQHYPKASIIGDGVIVFNLRGNRYRVAVKVSYQTQTVLITHAGTHAEYDRWDLS